MLGRLKKPLKFAAIGAGAIVGSAVAALYFMQNKMLYMPCPPGLSQKPSDNPSWYQSPKERGMLYEEFPLVTEDNVQLSAWFIYQKEKEQVPTVIFLHENAGNIGYRLDFFQMLYTQLHVNILAVSYRGYGASAGSPSEKGIQRDVRATLKYAFENAQIDRSKVIVFGRSLGGAVAIYGLSACPQYPVKGLILENTFTSIPDMVDYLMPALSPFKFLILRIKWESEKSIAGLNVPILFISGDSDQLIPPSHMKRLHAAAKSARWTEFVRSHVGVSAWGRT